MTARFFARLVLFAAVWSLGAPLAGADLFASEEPLAIRLSGPLDELVDAMDEPRPFPFTLGVGDEEYAVELSPRGKSRLKICRFPPLRLTFSEPPPDDSLFAGLGRVKLVTHCRDVETMQRNLLEEYAAYRIFNALTPIGYRVRLLDITYEDTAGRFDGQRYAFAIEPTDRLVERLGGEELELPAIYLSRFDAGHLALVSVYQYLIGNTDWSLVMAEGDDACCHNGKVVRLGDANYLIPYDYDRTGLVDASYAKPARSARIRHVTQRRYRGYCANNAAELLEAIRRTVEARPAIESIIRELPALDEKDRKSDLEFIGRYYERAADEQQLLSEFQKHCLG